MKSWKKGETACGMSSIWKKYVTPWVYNPMVSSFWWRTPLRYARNPARSYGHGNLRNAAGHCRRTLSPKPPHANTSARTVTSGKTVSLGSTTAAPPARNDPYCAMWSAIFQTLQPCAPMSDALTQGQADFARRQHLLNQLLWHLDDLC